MQYLVLPRDGDTPCDKLVVKVIVSGVEVHTFDSGELLDVQDIFTIDSPGLPRRQAREIKREGKQVNSGSTRDMYLRLTCMGEQRISPVVACLRSHPLHFSQSGLSGQNDLK